MQCKRSYITHKRTQAAQQVFIMLVRAARRIATEAAAKCDSSLFDVVGSWFVVVAHYIVDFVVLLTLHNMRIHGTCGTDDRTRH